MKNTSTFREIDDATLDEIAKIVGIPPQELDLFKEGFEWAVGFAQWAGCHDRRLKRRDVVPLLDGLIAALERIDDKGDAALVARLSFAGVDLENVGKDWFRAQQHIESLIESARRAKQMVELHLPKRGAPAGTRQGLALDGVLDYLLEMAEEWGIEWTAYKDRDDGRTAKGSLVQVLRLLAPYIVLPRSDATLLKAIDRARGRFRACTPNNQEENDRIIGS
jgi:hypothetical protein